ncbi:MAG TPA: ATP-binding protein [Tepidisphaeraceae bacterium]|nr:ATP-binding protein [Tepidisphaeraceae bacterium]
MTGEDFFKKIGALRDRVVEMQRHVPARFSGDDAAAEQAFEELTHALEELNVAESEIYERNAELAAAQQMVDEERQRYRELFELAPDGYLVTTAEGRIVEANRAAGPLLKIRSDLLVGRSLRDFVPLESEAAFLEQLDRARTTGTVQEFELPLRRRPETPITASVRLAAARDHDGQVMSLRWMLRDVTEQKRNAERLRMLNVELERRVAERTAELAAASQAKDQFLAVLSHELRTPLTPVLTAAMALDQDADRPEEVHRLAEMIRRNVELEARLIEDLLDLTRVSQGKLHFQREPVNIHDTIGRAMETCRSDMYGKCQQVKLELNATRTVVHADPTRIQQVLWNLLKNAVKFTPESGRITVRTEDVDDERIRIHITDTGIGMDANLARRAFNAFEQGGETVTRRFGGMGLGLTISKTLIDAHGGTLTASSTGPGEGSTFTIELPDARAPEHAPQIPRTTGAAQAAKKLRILLVEDHADTARLMARLLRRLGHVVHVVHTVAKGVEVFQREPIDLVLSDLGLPDGTGIDLMRRIKQERPVTGIALSGYGMEDDVQKSLAAGFRRHLTKPVNFTHLQEAIDSVMP